MATPRAARLLSILLAVALPWSARAEAPTPATAAGAAAPRLTVDVETAALVTGGELGVVGLSLIFKDRLAAPSCRWCEPPRLDRWARGQLRWRDTGAASTASDALQLLLPAGAAATLWMQAAPAGRREVAEDLLVLAESVSTAITLTQGAKYAAGRLRPDAWAAGGVQSADARLSFWSGHTAFTFATAAAATQIARLRGRARWRWLAAAGFGAAALTGWLRVAGDRHWLTDVATGALIGTGTGLAVPWLAYQPAEGPRPALTLVPAPGGLAVLF